MRILFLTLPGKGWDCKLMPMPFPHIGVASMLATLRQHGRHEAHVLDLSLDWPHWRRNLDAAIAQIQPMAIGVSVYSFMATEAKAVVAHCRHSSRAFVIAGGPHVSATSTGIFDEIPVHFGIAQDGELPLALLLDTLDCAPMTTDALDKIPNLIHRRLAGQAVHNPSQLDNPSTLPLPNYGAFDLSRYDLWRKHSYHIITSRGCPYRCTYCAAGLVSGRQFRARSPEHVMAELLLAKANGFRHFGILDDSFNADVDRAKTICRMMITENLGMAWDVSNGLRADRTDPELFALMRKAGCQFVGFGLEATTDEMLKRIKKGLTVARMEQALRECSEAGIESAVNLIIGHPGETVASARATLDYARNIPWAAYTNIYGLLPLPGTEAYAELRAMERDGKARFFSPPDEYLSTCSQQGGMTAFETDTLPAADMITLLRQGRNITEFAAMRHRFGRKMGLLLYHITRNRRVFFALNYLRNTRLEYVVKWMQQRKGGSHV